MRRKWIWIALAVIAGGSYAAWKFTPWPSVLLFRYAFGKDTENRNAALAKHLPGNITHISAERYGSGNDELLDVYFPADTKAPLPTIFWIHGGGFIFGTRSDVSDYLQILAARGYTTVTIDYSIAPGARYPTPTRQANQALDFIVRNADRLHIDKSKIILAGDSAGSQIAAQLAAIITSPAYASSMSIVPSLNADQLRGIVLFCGIYDATQLNLDSASGAFLRTVVWSCFGAKDLSDPRLAEFSVIRHLTPHFPPAFLSVGNDDPLQPQSAFMADALRAQGVSVDTLFFPANYQPPSAPRVPVQPRHSGRTTRPRPPDLIPKRNPIISTQNFPHQTLSSPEITQLQQNMQDARCRLIPLHSLSL